jgi:manganese-transporting P-type ATPase
MFQEVPSDYDKTFQTFTKKGFRVIALGMKTVKNTDLKRDQVESNMNFIGFALYQSDIKIDTKSTIDDLLQSNHNVIMITGDNILTAIHVSRELNIITKDTLILNEKQEWLDSDERIIKDIKNYNLCVNGENLELAVKSDKNWLKNHVEDISVFARVTPEQKELVITTLKSNGKSW